MSIRCLFSSAAVVALAWSANASAQQTETRVAVIDDESTVYGRVPIVVISSRGNPIDLANATGSLAFIDPDDLEQRQVRDVADVLRDVPGVAVSSIAGQTQIRLRGSEANHVLVLVDGIEVSDPFAGEFDIGTLQAEIGSRIEILRGPQSALYGSDAIGGVVAYHSANGAEQNGVSGWIEAGSNNTLNGAARLGLSDSTANLALSAIVASTDGEPNARGGSRDIGRDSYSLAGKGAIEIAPGAELRVSGRFIRTNGDFNDTDFDSTSPTFGFVVDTPGTRFENEALYALLGARFEALDGNWTHDLSGQFADIARDTFDPFGRTSGSDGDRLKASYVSSFRVEGRHSLTFAADWERERFRNDDPFEFGFTGRRKIENVGFVGEYRLTGSRFDVSAAIRHDINTRFADTTTFRIGTGYDLSADTRLRAAWGTGIKNPGFFELFGFFDGRFIGNDELKPEKSESWEIGIDQSLADDLFRLSATYFDSQLEDEIFTTFPAPDFVATPANRATLSKQRGVELSLRAQLGSQITFDGAYTYLDAEENGVEEVRRPGDIASGVLTWNAVDGAGSATLIVRYNGATDDLAFTDPSFIPVTERLGSYTLVNFNAELGLTKDIRLFGRIENLLNENYEQVFSFVSPGRTVIAGVRLTL